MAISPRLEMRQGQSLVMTPQLQQAIKLLQFSHVELTAYIEQELESNPLLERGGDQEDAAPEAITTSPAEKVAETSLPDPEMPETPGLKGDDTSLSASETASLVDTDVENIYPDTTPAEAALSGETTVWEKGGSGSGLSSGSFDDTLPDLEATLTRKPTLKEHLSDQLALSNFTDMEKLIGAHLIDLVDHNGYLHDDPAELARQLGTSTKIIENVRSQMRHFEPAGVFARSVAECLAFQLADKGLLSPEMETLLENLEKLARHEFKKLQNICQVDENGLMSMISRIKRLNPRPGDQFEDTPVQPVIPDVFVTHNHNGGWTIRLNTEALPKLLVNREYYKTISADLSKREEKEYISTCLQDANWLTKSLDQRARTILKVTEEIIRQQDKFLTDGVAYLRPLNLKTVAKAVKMHESTISRVTSNKYMATDRGVFELKYFFTSSIAASQNREEAVSSSAVKHRIKQLIDAETPDKVLSDDKIVTLLKAEGINIARRTVAKYREALHLPSSVQRRREKKARIQLADL